MKIAKTLLSVCLLIAVFLAGFGYGRWYGPRKSGGETLAANNGGRQLYHCPMHPTYISDKPGDCPICGMRLVPIRHEQPASATSQERPGEVLYYRDPHDPHYTSDKPGLNPETGNELEPVYAGETSAMPPGTIRVSPEKQQLIGVRFGSAEYTVDSQVVRAAGKVSYDETRIARVHAKVEGWIETVHAAFTGRLVRKGEPLLTLYSPELVATQQEYLLALKSRNLLQSVPYRGAGEHSDSLVAATRRRLELWDLSAEQIDRVARTGEPIKSITIESPVTGHITARNAFPSQRITPETELYTVVDLSRVWILADVFESDATRIRLGQAVRITPSHTGGVSFAGRVSYIQPEIDPATRTLKVRIEAPNPAYVLKPEMWVEAEFRTDGMRRLTVPSEAVLDSGLRQIVFVDRGNGYLEPRPVETGERLGERMEIRKGLRAGERVVISGNFLIDSESRLKSALGDMAGSHAGATPAASTPVSAQAPHQRPASPSDRAGARPADHREHGR